MVVAVHKLVGGNKVVGEDIQVVGKDIQVVGKDIQVVAVGTQVGEDKVPVEGYICQSVAVGY
jgi:predicted small secreted protein